MSVEPPRWSQYGWRKYILRQPNTKNQAEEGRIDFGFVTPYLIYFYWATFFLVASKLIMGYVFILSNNFE